MVGAEFVYGFEVDPDAIEIAQKNIEDILVDDEDHGCPVELVQCEIGTDFTSGQPNDACKRFEGFFDVVSFLKQILKSMIWKWELFGFDIFWVNFGFWISTNASSDNMKGCDESTIWNKE
jgi:hypothetical protein